MTPGLGRSSDSDLIRVWEQPAAISSRSVIDMVRIPSSDPVITKSKMSLDLVSCAVLR